MEETITLIGTLRQSYIAHDWAHARFRARNFLGYSSAVRRMKLKRG